MTKNGYMLVIDKGATSLGSAIVEGNNIRDITKDFIKFYNERFADKRSQ